MSSTATPTLRRTPLFERHQAAGARLVEFAGWEMPVQYQGVIQEHMAVREACGIFDVSHMGEIETSGPGAQALLQRLLSNDVAKIAPGGAQYSVLCREDGGVLDDLFTYRLDVERYLTVTNAANHERDLAWFAAHAQDSPEVRVTDGIEDWAMLAVQGPLAREIVQAIRWPISDRSPLPARMSAAPQRLAGAEVLVCGTGYTGEDGVELLCAPRDAPALWDEIVRRGAVPAGLGARDTLRLEVLLPPVRQRPERRSRADRGRAGVVLQGGHRLHRRGRRPRGAGARAGREARRVRHRGTRDRPSGQPRCSVAERSPAARSRHACTRASAWPTCPPSGRPRAPAWR